MHSAAQQSRTGIGRLVHASTDSMQGLVAHRSTAGLIALVPWAFVWGAASRSRLAA